MAVEILTENSMESQLYISKSSQNTEDQLGKPYENYFYYMEEVRRSQPTLNTPRFDINNAFSVYSYTVLNKEDNGKLLYFPQVKS